jgi:DNA polymerase III alpha subunit
LVAPLTTIKGLGDAAIDEIIEKRPFTSVEHLLFDGGVVARKLNKKSLDALCRANAMEDLMDDRFYGDKHFWSAVVLDKPKTKKKLNENIEKYKPEGSFTDSERIQNIQTITGIYPISKVVPQRALDFLSQQGYPPMSEFDMETMQGWCVPIKVDKKHTKNKKPYYIVDVIDINSVVTRVRCWGVSESCYIETNKLYILEPTEELIEYYDRSTRRTRKKSIVHRVKFSETWGFSTSGPVHKHWKKLGK